jgi:hypothetical protein
LPDRALRRGRHGGAREGNSGTQPEPIVEQAMNVAQGIAAGALAGDEAADGLAAPADGTRGPQPPAVRSGGRRAGVRAGRRGAVRRDQPADPQALTTQNARTLE